MTESNTFTSAKDKQIDQLLRQTFDSNQGLSTDFEDRVMSSIQRNNQQSRQGRTALIIMSVYWVLASLTGAWLWFDKLSGGFSLANIKIILPMMLMIGLGLIVLLRQASLKLSDLFFATIR
jgi:hypothetical protein